MQTDLDPALAVEQVLATVRGTTITELEVEWEGGSLRLRRERAATSSAGSPAEELPVRPSDEVVVTSAYVGVFYRDRPGGLPEAGAWVAAGATLGEVETLRVRNSVVAPIAGIVLQLLVEDRTPVEYGQPLVVLRASAEPSGPSEI